MAKVSRALVTFRLWTTFLANNQFGYFFGQSTQSLKRRGHSRHGASSRGRAQIPGLSAGRAGDATADAGQRRLCAAHRGTFVGKSCGPRHPSSAVPSHLVP